MEIEELNRNKLVFKEHKSLEDLSQKIKEGIYFQGKLFVSRNNNLEAKIFIHKFDFEIVILGLKNLNRSLNGDIVAVKICKEKSIYKFK